MAAKLILLVCCFGVASAVVQNYCKVTGTACTTSATCASGQTCVNRDNKNKVCCATANLGCQDLNVAGTTSNTCASNKASGLCSDPNYTSLITTQCPATCGLCSGSPTCADVNVSECLKNVALCSNSAYNSVMSVQCRKTCGYCTSG
ncbi:unnamed protein product, partial [Mesorhabditis spiculigera]